MGNTYLSNLDNKELEPNFKWRDRKGNFYLVKDMETRHLFYTWLMIWNNAAPFKLRIWFKNRYSFPAFYTKEYMLKSFKHIYFELKKRSDLGFKCSQVVKQIEDFYKQKK